MSKITIIGAGHVGSHCAYTLAVRGICGEIVMIDTNRGKCDANAKDVADGISYFPAAVKVRTGDYTDCTDSDIIAISIGKPREPGQTRLDVMYDSVRMLKDVCENLKKIDIKGIIISITNPADVIADYVRKALDMPRERCFSTGTALDTARLVRTVGELAEVDPKSVSAFSMGEHGNSSMIPFSCMTIGGLPFDDWGLSRDVILERTREIGNEIIEGKGSTEFGIGTAFADMVKAILFDEKRIMPASVLLCGEYNQIDVHAGVPCIIGKNGIEKIIELPITESEWEEFNASCDVLRKHISKAAAV